MYLIARLNLAINEQSEKFGTGLMIKLVWVSMGKNWGRNGEYKLLKKVMGGGLIGEFLVV